MKKSPLKKYSKRRKERRGKANREVNAMKEFFASFWGSLRKEQRRCYETGDAIYDPRTFNFHHVLPKEIYPQYQYSTWNIVLVGWTIHDQIHRDIDRLPKVKALYEELLLKHQNGELKP